MKRRTRGRGATALVAIAGLAVTLSCSSNGGAARGPAPPGDVVLVAKKTAWDKDHIDVPVGRQAVIVVDNQDKGTAHNIHFTTLPGKVATKLEPGIVYQTLDVRFDAPGDYPYICDLHPTMKGVATAR